MARPALAFFFNHSVLNTVLQKYVDEEGYVDYTSIRLNSLTALESYFETAANVDLAGWPAPERQAFWINIYNARVLYEIAQKPELRKISQEWAFFEKPFQVAGQRISLVDIKKLLRKENDPRLLGAISDGSISSPKLRNKAYTPDNLEVLLTTNAPLSSSSVEREWTIRDIQQKTGYNEHHGPDSEEIPPDALSITHPGLGENGK